MSVKLKPCPHCGREDCSASAEDHGNTEQERWWGNIFCQGCQMHGPDIGPEDTYEAWFEKAVEVWNALPRRLQWTKEPPQNAEYDIWLWREYPGTMPQPYTVYLAAQAVKGKNATFLVAQADLEDDRVRRVSSMGGEWAGPISAPKEQK